MSAPIHSFTLRGIVTNTGAGPIGPTGLRVVAVDQEDGTGSVMVTATTSEGAFELPFTEDDTMALLRGATFTDLWEDSVAFHLSVFNGDVLLSTSHQTVRLADLVLGRLPQALSVDLTGTARMTFEVSGRVLDGSGRPQGNLRVTAHRVEPGGSTALATDTTDANGSFSVSYPGHDGSTPEDPKLDLQLVVTRTDTGIEVTRSPIVFSPGPRLALDIVTDGTYLGRSEYERIEAAVVAVAPGVPMHELTGADLELVAKRADVHPLHLAKLIQAARLAQGGRVGAQAFYALLRAEFPPDLSGILSRSLEDMRQALTAAFSAWILPSPPGGDVSATVDAMLSDLEDLIVDATMSAAAPGQQGMREALDVSGLPEATLRTWMRLWVRHEGTQDEFWAKLDGEPSLTQAEVATLRFTAESAATTKRFIPVMSALQSERAAGNISTMADLVRWDVAEWIAFLTPLGVPEGTPGEDETAQVTHYAAEINRTLGERHPTRRLASRIERDAPRASAGVSEFLEANPTFDIDHSVVSVFLDENPGSMPAGFDPAETEANLKSVQRIHRLAPPFERYEVTRALLDAGFTSASQIVHLGKTGFTAAVEERLEGVHSQHDAKTLTGMLYASAMVKHGMSMAVMSQYGAAFNTTPLVAIPPQLFGHSGEPGSATLANLFGSLDYCACEHCRSVFSPSAYLVDLLVLLEGIPATSEAPNALEVLRGRRADILGLELSCINTNTALPYIDLVNELLEQHVVDPAAPLVPLQTTRSAAELRLDPEHRNDLAYDAPAAAVFPWSLPVRIPTQELRAYCEQLGVPRIEAMRTLRSNAGAPGVEDITAEALGLSRQAAHVLSGDSMFTAGVTSTPTDLAWGMAGVAGFDQVLAGDLRQLLDRAGLELDELVALLEADFVNPGGTVTLDYAGDDPSCDLDDISLLNVTPAVLDRLHRFVRLARVTGRSRDELLLTIDELGGGTLDADYLVALVELGRVEQRLGLTAAEACALFGELSTTSYGGRPSQFEAVYQDPLLSREPDPAFDLAGSELANPVALEPAHHATIRAALGLNEADLVRLVEAVLPQPSPMLNVANLSILHRHARLARALRVSISDLLRLRGLCADDPFQDPAGTLAFVAAWDEISASGTTVELLDYLCRHQVSPDDGLHPSSARVVEVVKEITDGVTALEQRLAVTGDLADVVRIHLQAVFSDLRVVEDWVRVLDLDVLSSEDQAILESSLESVGIDSSFVAETLVPAYGSSEAHQVAADFLVEQRRTSGRRALVAATLGAALGIDAEVASMLASNLLSVDVDGISVSVFDALVDVSLLDADGNPTQAQMDAIRPRPQGGSARRGVRADHR